MGMFVGDTFVNTHTPRFPNIKMPASRQEPISFFITIEIDIAVVISVNAFSG